MEPERKEAEIAAAKQLEEWLKLPKSEFKEARQKMLDGNKSPLQVLDLQGQTSHTRK